MKYDTWVNTAGAGVPGAAHSTPQETRPQTYLEANIFIYTYVQVIYKKHIWIN